MSKNGQESVLDNSVVERAFEELDRYLQDKGETLDLICVGGYVLSLHGLKTTKDVDAFYKSSETINKMIREVGEHYDLNDEEELWLNNSVANVDNAPPAIYYETKYAYSNLKVYAATLEYILGMKCGAARKIDIDDMGKIIAKLELRDICDTYDQLIDMGFTGLDISDLTDAFSKAYGDEWLASYLSNNQDRINQY